MDTSKKAMKKSGILLLATLPAAISLVTAAANVQAAPEVYGKLNVSMQQNHATTDAAGSTWDNWSLDSNASRIGVKGAADLDGGLKGIYKLEYGTDVTDGDTTWTARNSYVGVQGSWGTVIGGKFDTPTKEARGKIDQFIDNKLADIQNVIVGENRASNIAMYTTKIASNITVNAAVIPGENSGAAPGKHNNGAADSASASVVYDTDKLYLALAVDNHVISDWGMPFMGVTPYVPVLQETDVVRLAGQVKLDALSLGAIIQRAEDVETTASNEKQDGIILSAAFAMNKETLKAQFGHSKYSISDAKTNSLSLGLDHSMSKDAKAYAYVSELKTTDLAPGIDGKQTTFGVGYEQKF